MQATSSKLNTPTTIAFARLTKVDEEKRLVFCRAVQQVPDRAGEEFDYAGSKPHFKKWSDEQLEASMGKSAGNIREMHGKNAAGAIIPNGLIFNDEECAIDTVTHVVDDGVWQKILKGVYTGQSIGGEYVSKSEPDPARDGLVRYVAKPSEISFVDRPAVPTATIFEIQKADGSIEKREFVPIVVRQIVRRDGKDLAKKMDDRDLPKLGEEFDLEGQRYALIKVENGKAFVDEVYDLVGSPEELNELSKTATELGLSIKDLTLLAAKHAPRALKLASPEAIEAKARELCKAAGEDPEKQIGLTRGGGKRLAWADFVDEANKALAAEAVAKADLLAEPSEDAIAAKMAEIAKAAGVPDITAEAVTDEARAKFKAQAIAELKKVAKVAAREDVSPKEGKQKYGNVTFADEKNKKYPIDTEAHIRAAWSYINMPKNSGKYSAEDLASIKAKIKAAAKKKGIEISEKADGVEFEKVATTLAVALAKRDKVEIDGLKLDDPKAAPYVARAERAILRKGLATCGQLAYLLDALCQVAESMELETMREGDDSGIADDIYVHIAGLGECLRDCVAEEVAEEVEGDEGYEAAHGHNAAVMAAAEGLIARVGELRKASHVAVSTKRVQKMHDHCTAMGAKCDKANLPNRGGDPELSEEYDSESAKAALAELEKSADVSSTAKVVLRKGLTSRVLAKVDSAPDPKALEKAVEAAVAPFKEKLAKAEADVATLKAQPAPATVRIRAIGKEEDAGIENAQRLASDVKPVLKGDGTVDEVATAMKMVRATGGTLVDPRQPKKAS